MTLIRGPKGKGHRQMRTGNETGVSGNHDTYLELQSVDYEYHAHVKPSRITKR